MRLVPRPVVIVAMILPASSFADLSSLPSGSYEVDDQHGYILFSYSHLGFSNPQAGFNRFDATLELDSDDPAASAIRVVIDAGSIDSRVPDFDEHLNGADFFDTAVYPQITFESTTIEASGEDTYEVSGNLTIKNTSRPVTLTATINRADTHPMKRVPAVGISAEGTLLRSEWGLGKYAPAVSDEVRLTVEVEMLHRK